MNTIRITPTIRITLTLEQAQALLKLVSNDNTATKNHIASAVEHDRPDDHKVSAKALVKMLREGEQLFATVNGAILRATGVIKDDPKPRYVGGVRVGEQS